MLFTTYMTIGYYQPAGPLISPHVLPPVATGPPPTLTNVSLLPASTTPGTASGGSSKQKQHEIPTPLSSDPEHLHTAPSTTSAADSTDSDVLITGGDLTPFRYPASSATGTIPTHQHPTSQQQQQQHHQLHQQAAAAAAAHQGSPYPRAMHAAQMHYLTAYPPNYYAPYPGEAMCYSPPTAAYQPYFPTKVYQSGPPHPPPGAYRRYPYYQPGPPPADLYEAAPPPPPPQQTNSSSSSAQSTAGPQSTQSASQTVPTAPSQSGAGSQLVPAGPAAHAQHLEHYPGPPGYYSGYSPGNTAAGQCYTRTIQGPYMEYPPQCPCPMQQSCPKNVHTGPHIGSNNGNSNSHHTNGSSSSNSSSSSNNTNTPIITSISGSNTTAMNHNNSNSSSNSIVTGSQSSNSIGKTTSNTTSSTPMNVNNSSNNSNSCNSMMNTVTTNRGPVKNLLSEQQRQQPQQQQQRETAQFLNSFHQEDLLKTSVKSEMKTEETDCKSQYEDHVVQPPTPPESYGTNDDKSLLIDDDIMDEAMEKLEMARLSAVAATAAATLPTSTLSTQPEQQNDSAITSPTSPSPDIIVPTNIEAYDLTKTTSPPLNSIQTTNACSSSNSINQNSGLVPSNTQITQPTLVGRKARIGKTMAREMVYAAAATTTVSQQQQQQQQQLQMRNTTQQSSTVPIAITTTTTTTPTISTATTVATTTSSSPTAILALPFLATIKTEIKAEHIKLEDDIMDTILRQQHINNTDSSSYNDHNELKIKAEPLSTFDGETNSSHNTVFDILSRYHQSGQEEIARITPHPFRQDSFDDVDGSASITMPKPINEGRMRLAPNWQQSPKINCEIDLSMASDDDVLDLRQSPLPGDANSSKRIKILDFHNTSSGACKKSSPNSYKNLIKQAEPKAYLCLSRRRIDKRNRYSIIQRKAMTNGSFLNVRRRHVVLTEQQKERLKLRRKKLIALERKRQEALDRKRAAFRRRRLEAKQAEKAARAEENLLKTEKTEEDEEQNVLEIVQQQQRVSEKPSMTAINEVQSMSTNSIHQRTSVTPKASPKHAPKPKKVSAIPLHLIEASDAMARGYFSEPETRCSSVLGGSKYGCEMMVETNGTRTTPLSVAATKSALAEISCRKQKKTKISIAEKRSKSETKKPIKSSTNLQTFLTPDLLYTQAQKQEFSRSEVSSMNVNNLITSTSNSPDETATTKTTMEDTSLSTLWNGDAVTTTKSTSKKHGKSKKHKESKSKSTKNATKTSKNIKSTKSKSSKHNKKHKSFSDDAVKSTINDALPPISRESHNDDGNGDEDLTESIENMDQSIPRETNNNEIIEKSTTIVDIPSQTSSAEKLISKCEIESKSLASQAAENQIESAQLPHATDTAAAIAVPVAAAAAAVALQHQQQHQQAENLQHQHTSLAAVTSSSHSDKNQLFLQPALPPRILCHSHHFHGKRTRSRAKFGPRKRQKQKHSTVSYELDERPPPALRGDAIPKWNNGWTWDGEPFQGAVFLNSDDPLVIRTCYAAMRHSEGDIIRTRDCVLLKANEDDELPYVAKVAHLWENPEDGEMMVSLLWYYRPEHTEQGRQPNDSPDEVYASRHRDHNSVACIEDKCYVLTFSEYCRYRRRLRANEEEIEDVSIVPKPASSFYCAQKVPDNTNPELVMFCHRAYEFRSKRLLKMPNKQDYYVVNN